MLRTRDERQELIDDPALPDEDFAAAMADLARVNFWLRGHAPTLSFLRRHAPRGGFSLLDVGAGQGDLLRSIERWTDRRGIPARLTGIDLAAGGALAAGRAGTRAAYLTGDVFAHEPATPYDFIVSALFTHHLPDADIVRFLRWMDGHAVRGWHINDLHRHPLALWGYAALSSAMRWHPIVRHDGRLSVRRAFTRADWRRLLREAGVTARITWHPLFRWGVSSVR
ncbi:methyltransferase domain-containing protein [Pacificimonas flava]|uniref:Methyltransferase type 12 n=1 Tax=Pacificimonas flava TaxID=1234595 RepID=M2SF72_9SPHN|nr:methyltransferase domain-containing protein [Pacificimonas flava]EMD84005.1 Methyltransferase type 12 [Pacificimonas flava]MBB5281022.1 trans-aconitate methyltransferase [Pacificimonas flava]